MGATTTNMNNHQGVNQKPYLIKKSADKGKLNNLPEDNLTAEENQIENTNLTALNKLLSGSLSTEKSELWVKEEYDSKVSYHKSHDATDVYQPQSSNKYPNNNSIDHNNYNNAIQDIFNSNVGMLALDFLPILKAQQTSVKVMMDVQTRLTNLLDQISKFLLDSSKNLSDYLTTEHKKQIEQLHNNSFWSALAGFFAGIGEAIMGIFMIQGSIAASVATGGVSLPGVVVGVFMVINGLTKAFAGIGGMVDPASMNKGPTANVLQNGVFAMFGTAAGIANQVISVIMLLGGSLDGIMSQLGNVGVRIGTSIAESAPVKFLGEALEVASTAFGKVMTEVGESSLGVASKEMLVSIGGKLDELGSLFADFAIAVNSKIIMPASQFISKIIQPVTDMIKFFEDSIAWIANKAVGLATSEPIKYALETVLAPFKKLLQGLKQFAGYLVDQLPGLPDVVKRMFLLSYTFTNLGCSLYGMISGIMASNQATTPEEQQDAQFKQVASMGAMSLVVYEIIQKSGLAKTLKEKSEMGDMAFQMLTMSAVSIISGIAVQNMTAKLNTTSTMSDSSFRDSANEFMRYINVENSVNQATTALQGAMKSLGVKNVEESQAEVELKQALTQIFQQIYNEQYSSLQQLVSNNFSPNQQAIAKSIQTMTQNLTYLVTNDAQVS